MAEPKRVLIADDHPLFLDALALMVGRDPTLRLVARATSGREALELLRSARPDVAVLDLEMGEVSGLDVVSAIAADGLPTRALLVSGSIQEGDAQRFVRAGASGVLSKEAGLDEIGRAIRRVAEGETVLGRGDTTR